MIVYQVSHVVFNLPACLNISYVKHGKKSSDIESWHKMWNDFFIRKVDMIDSTTAMITQYRRNNTVVWIRNT